MRYIKLYFTCLKRAIISRLQYKADSIIGIIGFLISNTATLLSIYFIIDAIPSLNGWSIYELGFLYGFSMMPVAFDHFFSDELWNTAYWKIKNVCATGAPSTSPHSHSFQCFSSFVRKSPKLCATSLIL